MSEISLHRASRILEAINTALKVSEPKFTAKISVFSDASSEVDSRRKVTAKAIERTEKLLCIRGRVRERVAAANVEVGISELLTVKHSWEDMLKVLERVPGVAPEQKPVSDDEIYFRRRQKAAAPVALLDVSETLIRAEATRARFKESDSAVETELEIGTVTEEDAVVYRRKALECRREADRVTEKLRALNATTNIVINPDDMEWLTTNEVV